MRKILLSIIISLSILSSYAQTYLPKSEGEIVEHTYYTLAYAEEHEQAYWVYYVLTPEMVSGDVKRSDDFRADNKVKTGSATLTDYKSSGYDRGHLCPAASMSINTTAMSESFYMSNMSPQTPSFNRGGWKKLEDKVRGFALKEQKIYVVTGPIFNDVIGTIGANNVTIPGYYYKAIYAPEANKMIAFIMPNTKIESGLASYAVSVDYLEDITGIDFFYELPDDIENELEANFNVSYWAL
ncbi:MAG: DNA/RNA non-specific endonuclease [bacterium]